ncbi:hypothetical protein P171DRAFT_430455 [Karstenula rhodostoma CBS 690.94]|uniref:Uncharacterized protein n=1 Tax=Karstenula rhodostoma CBS 690.94 TaxID=1392251 RepID=A0A9P4UC27_9PLEO|nr:hypothetical protein P171DRAFT_430455 [Karstenula rhodostoma CBS 690.94]
MAEESQFYITSVAHGMVLARSPNGQPSGVVAQNRGDQDLPQKWVAEQGDAPNIIALRCLSNNEYLHANGGGNWATVGTGAKQWWKLDINNVTAPGACRLSPVEYPNVFLNHFQGIRVAKGQSMKVHMWQWEQPNQFCLTWYFLPADGSFGPNTSASGAASDSKKAADAKIEELEASKKTSDAKLKEFEDTKKASDAQLKELQDTKKASDAKLKDLQDTKNASDAKLQELEASKQEYAAKLQALEAGKAGSAAAIQDLQDKLARQSRDLDAQKAALQRNVDDQKAQDARRALKKAGKQDAKMQKKEEKALKKEDKPQKKPQKLQHANKLPPTPPASPPQEKATLPATTAPNKEVRNACKHVVLPPPRKIRRKVVGIVYAQ